MQQKPLIGIIGGLGPMASVYFYEMLTEHTPAKRDQDHIDIYISSRASTPDRTDFITGKSGESPLPYMVEDAKKLVACGATLLVMPCNTAHRFYGEIANAVSVPFINIIEETVRFCASRGMKKIGLLATEGTIASNSYMLQCEKAGLSCEVPDKAGQDIITETIYGLVKQGRRADMGAFSRVSGSLLKRGCDSVILGCTELSLVKKQEKLHFPLYTDSLEVLAYKAIEACGKTPTGFDFT